MGIMVKRMGSLIPSAIITLYLGFFFIACTNNKVIDEDKFVKIYTDIIIAQDTLPLTKSTFDSLKLSIFKKYGITSEQYDSTIKYYNRDVKRWESFFSKAAAVIDTLRTKRKSI